METQDALSSFSHIVNTGHYTTIQKQIFIATIFVLRIFYFKTHTFFFFPSGQLQLFNRLKLTVIFKSIFIDTNLIE